MLETGKECQVDLLSALHLLKVAWATVNATSIAICFCHAGFPRPCDNSEQAQFSDSEEADADLVSTLQGAGVCPCLTTYTAVESGVATCRSETTETLRPSSGNCSRNSHHHQKHRKPEVKTLVKKERLLQSTRKVLH